MDEEKGLSIVDSQALGAIVQQMMNPIMETMAGLLRQNMEALRELSQTQKMQSDRLEALERQLRLNTPVSTAQEGYLKTAIRQRSEELLEKKGFGEDRKAAASCGRAIRKAVLGRYGAGALREIPKHEYEVAMRQIETWNDQGAVLKIVREARGRAEDTGRSGIGGPSSTTAARRSPFPGGEG